LQTILEKAKETLAGHTGASPDLKAAHAELTELASKVISDPSTFAASLPQHLAGLNPPELSNHHASAAAAMQGVINNQAPAMVASGRMSDTSSQKSHLTNLTAIHEDSDHSGVGDQPTAPGTRTPPNYLNLRGIIIDGGGILKNWVMIFCSWDWTEGRNNNNHQMQSSPQGSPHANGVTDAGTPPVALERPTPRRGAIPSIFADNGHGNGNGHHAYQVSNSTMAAPQNRIAVKQEGAALDLNHRHHVHHSNGNGNGVPPPRGSGDLDLNAYGWER
jgi:hypothetical protein